MTETKDILPELSIIVPNYNNSKYLDDCIQSILQQTFKDYEIIISDDHSTDDSVRIINNWIVSNPRIRLLQQKKNVGVSQTRHSAILQARGKYITTLDSDDVYYDSRKLELEIDLVKYYEKTYNKSICSFSNTAFLDEKLNFKSIRSGKERICEGFILNNIIARTCEIPINFITKKENYFKIGGYDPNFKLYEDWDLKIRIAKKYEFYYSGIVGTGYRRHGDGLSNASLDKHIRVLRRIFNKNRRLIEKKEYSLIKKNLQKHLEKLKAEFLIRKIKEREDLKKYNNSFVTIIQNIKLAYYKLTL